LFHLGILFAYFPIKAHSAIKARKIIAILLFLISYEGEAMALYSRKESDYRFFNAIKP
jgi:hypothetical protein